MDRQNPPVNLDPLFYDKLDSEDILRSFQQDFFYPEISPFSSGHKVIYLVGNSLGLQPKKTEEYIKDHLSKWANQAVNAHFTSPNPWVSIDDIVVESTAKLVGALNHEVVVMNSLTCNLHLMITAFYKPNQIRHKIIIEKKCFPSDYYAVESQILHHGYSTATSLIEIEPRDGEMLLRMEDIEKVLQREGHSVALVLFSGVQYLTGQLFDIPAITKLAKAYGCVVGFDLAHAVGNVPLMLHDWGVDFAVWCGYKYLNAGPGGIAGCFIHECHTVPGEGPLQGLRGWWGNRLETRFDMEAEFDPCYGAYSFRLSNPSVLLVAALRASLDIFDQATMDNIRLKSVAQTGYLIELLRELVPEVSVITPTDPSQRGSQLSLLLGPHEAGEVHRHLEQRGILCDVRKPSVLRVAPVALYNTYRDVFDFTMALREVLETMRG